MAITAGQFAFWIIACATFLFWQLAVVPKHAPKSHYQVLGVKPNSTNEELTYAYNQLMSLRIRHEFDGVLLSANTLQIQHAFEILSDPLRRRDYDHFDQDEIRDIVRNLLKKIGDAPAKLHLPLWKPFRYEPGDIATRTLASDNFSLLVEVKETWLIQILSHASRRCMEHEEAWRHISEQMDGVAYVGRIELGELKLATYFAERNWASGSFYFRHGLPAYVALPANCKSQDCMIRYEDKLTVDQVVDWMATQVLRLPQILYYSPETVVRNFIQKSGPHKVKVLIFSRTGERAAPFFRKMAKEFWEFVALGLVLWREENATLWENMLGVESAPAIVFFKDPSIKPIIYYGDYNSSTFESLMQQHKMHVIPQLRGVTVGELGCSETGYSLAGKHAQTWYCVIVAGRPGFELSQARGVLRQVKDSLTNVDSEDFLPQFSVAASAFKEKRLNLAWLDGSVQKDLCYFYLSSEKVHETCGPKSFPDQVDVPRVFIVRYRRYPKDHEKISKKKNHFNTIWTKLLEDEDLASQIVAKYNGSLEVDEIITWLSAMIQEGDTQDLLFYIKRAPALVDEESKPAWLIDAHIYVSGKTEGLKNMCKKLYLMAIDYLKEPSFVPAIVLVIALYVGSQILKPKQTNRLS